MPSLRHLTLRLTLIAAAAICLLPAAAPVLAHPIVVGTDPADGATLAESPRQIRVWFTEPILLDFTTVELTDGNGRVAPISALRVEGNALVLDLPPLPPNAYRLTWKILSDEDLHLSTGSLVFGVQQAVEAPTLPAPPAPSPTEVLLRWLGFGAMAGLIGAFTIALGLLPSTPADREAHSREVRRRLLGLALAAGLLALVVGLGLLWFQARSAGASSLGGVWQIASQTAYGARWLLRQSLLAELALAAWFLRRRRPGARFIEFVGMALPALALVALQAQSSHAASLEDTSPLKVSLDALHLLAASLWSGGLLALVVAVVPLLRREPALAWVILHRFSGIAALSVGVLFATGLYNSGQQVASPDALLFTSYGQLLIVKAGLALLVGMLGLLNSALLHPQVAAGLGRILRRPPDWRPFAPSQLWKTVTLEALAAGIVLLLTALLTASTPPRGPEFEPPAPPETAPPGFTANAADLLVTLSIKPSRPGQNFINLGVFNTRRPPPAPIEKVQVELQPPGQPGITLTAEALEDGKYQIISEAIQAPGEWQVTVTAIRLGQPDAVVSTTWEVLPILRTPIRRPVLISNHPLAPLLTPAAAGLALFAGAAALWLWLRPRTVFTPPAPLHPARRD